MASQQEFLWVCRLKIKAVLRNRTWDCSQNRQFYGLNNTPKLGWSAVGRFWQHQDVWIHKTLGIWVPLLFASLSIAELGASPVRFKAVKATFQGGSEDSLRKTIDGFHASPDGWSVAPRFDSRQSVIFVTEEEVKADILNLTLFFMSGQANTSFARFSVFYTTAANPDFKSRWEKLPLLNFGGIPTELHKKRDNSLQADELKPVATGAIPDSLYWISARTYGKPITGFRINVYPVVRSGGVGPIMSWATQGDFILTEFKVDVISTTTNVALGAPVTASHPLYSKVVPQVPAALTDGWPATFAHPDSVVSSRDFYFEIKLGKVRTFDHFTLRQRGEHLSSLDRFRLLRVQLYDEDPKSGARPTWVAINRPDGTYPDFGVGDILRPSDGKGICRGRYVRISTASKLPSSPQLAEFEAYETRTARLVSVNADDHELAIDRVVRVPPHALRLKFQFDIPGFGMVEDRPYRWRMRGLQNAWQVSDSLLLELPCPPAGDYTLEAQAAHSDGTWDASVFAASLTVIRPFTQSPSFFWLMTAATLCMGWFVAWLLSRRKLVALKSEAAVATERTRIARDVHDAIGAQLSQLAFMLKSLGGSASLPADTRASVDSLTEISSAALGSLDEVVWSVNPKNDRLEALCQRLTSYASRYLSPLGIACRINSPPTWPERAISAHVRHQVSMVFKEALQNVVKHSGATEVRIHLEITNGSLEIRISDNGRGFPDMDVDHERSGLVNMRSRLAGIGGQFGLHTSADQGVEVRIQIPLD